jgi:hypothetical membrane protein
MSSPFWQQQIYRLVACGCGAFVVLTVLAMIVYPGGLFSGELTQSYDFFRNFFSDLGRIKAVSGESNLPSAILFIAALSIAGTGLICFFIAFRSFFISDQKGRRWSLAGTVIGVASGACFIGIALAPYDLFFQPHYEFVMWAFRTFLLAVGIYAYVIFRQQHYPRSYGWVFVAFALLLAAYLALLTYGPNARTATGLVIQATGQKIIVYVSILSVMTQSLLAHRFRTRQPGPAAVEPSSQLSASTPYSVSARPDPSDA